MRYTVDGLQEVAIEAVVPGDRLLIQQGEVVPLAEPSSRDAAVINASTPTGALLPIAKQGRAFPGSDRRYGDPAPRAFEGVEHDPESGARLSDKIMLERRDQAP